MSKIKTLTLLPSAVAREGSWPPRLQGCAQGPCRAARRVTAHVSWGELAAAPYPCPLAFPGNRGEETEAKRLPSPCAAPPVAPRGDRCPVQRHHSPSPFRRSQDTR